jgi:hypothetical protein
VTAAGHAMDRRASSRACLVAEAPTEAPSEAEGEVGESRRAGTPGSPQAEEALSQKHAGNRRRHQIGHGSSQHGADPKLCQFASLVGRERADAAQLNSDRT